MKTTNDGELRVCSSCPVQHYENCTECFGFGMRSSGGPMYAREAITDRLVAVPCPNCGSTEAGLPT